MLNPVEEIKFAELRDKCRELGVPAPPEIHIGLKVHDKDGKLTFEDVQRGHSWTRNFYNSLFGWMADAGGSGSNNFGAGYLNSRNTGTSTFYDALYCGTNKYGGASTILGSGMHNVSTNSDFGIMIGTGSTAFSVEHKALATKIVHGNTAGTLYYQAMVAPVQLYTAGTKTWKNTLSRIFNNNSGGSITVAEVGLYSYCAAPGTASSTSLWFMFERSVLSPTVAVPNGAQLTVTYEISMDFSAID